MISACGRADLPFAGAWLASLCRNGSPERHYDVVLLAGNIDEEDSRALELQAAPYPHIRFRTLDCSSLGCAEEAYRIHIPALFPDYDKALYTDPRAIFCCDPMEIFTRSLGDAYCAAVPHHFEMRDAKDTKRLFTYPDIAVLLLNLAMLRNSDVQQAMHSALHAGLPVPEVIAEALDGEFAPLPADMCVSANLEEQTAQPVLLRAQRLARTTPRIINFNFSENLLRQATGLATCFWHAARSSHFYETLRKALGCNSPHAAPQQTIQAAQQPAIVPLQPARTLQERLFFRLRPTQAVADSLLRSGAFDIPYYMAANPDVVQQGADPVMHYVLYGWKEGRDPAPWFHTRQYLQNYPDVAKSQMNPFYHYMAYGINEQRRTC